MRKLTALALTALTAVVALTVAATTAPAQARDTTWGCPTCVATHR